MTAVLELDGPALHALAQVPGLVETLRVGHETCPPGDAARLCADLMYAIENAGAADPDCTQCGGTGEILLPFGHGDDADCDYDRCPVCRPWRNGFPGLCIAGRDGWLIAPYGPSECLPVQTVGF